MGGRGLWRLLGNAHDDLSTSRKTTFKKKSTPLDNHPTASLNSIYQPTTLNTQQHSTTINNPQYLGSPLGLVGCRIGVPRLC